MSLPPRTITKDVTYFNVVDNFNKKKFAISISSNYTPHIPRAVREGEMNPINHLTSPHFGESALPLKYIIDAYRSNYKIRFINEGDIPIVISIIEDYQRSAGRQLDLVDINSPDIPEHLLDDIKYSKGVLATAADLLSDLKGLEQKRARYEQLEYERTHPATRKPLTALELAQEKNHA